MSTAAVEANGLPPPGPADAETGPTESAAPNGQDTDAATLTDDALEDEVPDDGEADDGEDAGYGSEAAAADSGGESAYEDLDDRPVKPPRKKARKSEPAKEGADGSPAGSTSGTPAKGKGPASKRKGPKSAASGLKITCHNCHQSQNKISDLARCRVERSWTLTGKPIKPTACAQTFCQKCLNKYDINGKEVPDDWACPVCQFICTCSTCRRQREDTTVEELRARRAKNTENLLAAIAHAEANAADKNASKAAARAARAAQLAAGGVMPRASKVAPLLDAPTFTPIEGLPSHIDDPVGHRDKLLSRLWAREILLRFRNEIMPGIASTKVPGREASLAALCAVSIDPVGFWEGRCLLPSDGGPSMVPLDDDASDAEGGVGPSPTTVVNTVELTRHVLGGCLALVRWLAVVNRLRVERTLRLRYIDEIELTIAQYARQAVHDMRMRIAEDTRLVQARALCKTSDEAWELAADFFGLPMPEAMDVDGHAVDGVTEPITAERRLAVIEAAIDRLMTGDILRDELSEGDKRLANGRNDQIRLRKERAEARTAELEAEPSEQDEPEEHEVWARKRREAEYIYDEAIARNFCSLGQQKLRVAPVGVDLLGNGYYTPTPAMNTPPNDEAPLYVYGPGPLSNRTTYTLRPPEKKAATANGDAASSVGDPDESMNVDPPPPSTADGESAPPFEEIGEPTPPRWWIFRTAAEIRELSSWVGKCRSAAAIMAQGGKKRARPSTLTAAESRRQTRGRKAAGADEDEPTSEAAAAPTGPVETVVHVPIGALVPFVSGLTGELDAYADFIAWREKERSGEFEAIAQRAKGKKSKAELAAEAAKTEAEEALANLIAANTDELADDEED